MSFIRCKTIDAIQEGIASSRQCVVICEKQEEIIEEINNNLIRGATVIDAVGGYSHMDKKFIYVVIQSSELSTLKSIVKNVEPTAFVTVAPVKEIMGNYRRNISI
jgi:uncharacterized membrane-anchored protein YitT (DUF2179 family)